MSILRLNDNAFYPEDEGIDGRSQKLHGRKEVLLEHLATLIYAEDFTRAKEFVETLIEDNKLQVKTERNTHPSGACNQ